MVSESFNSEKISVLYTRHYVVVLLATSFFQFMSASEIVTNEKTAVAVGSGGLSVYATPAMIALMEKSAYESVQSLLEEGSGTVGTLIQFSIYLLLQ